MGIGAATRYLLGDASRCGMVPYPTLATSTGMTEASVTTTASGGRDTWNVVGTTGASRGPPQCHVEGLSEVGRGEVATG